MDIVFLLFFVGVGGQTYVHKIVDSSYSFERHRNFTKSYTGSYLCVIIL